MTSQIATVGLFDLLTVDISLAIGLVIAAVGVILLSNIGLLPKKSIPWVLLAIGATFGFAWFKDRQAKGLRKKLEEQEKELKKLAQRMEKTRAETDAEHAKLEKAKTELRKVEESTAKSILELEAKGREERVRIAQLEGEELEKAMSDALARL